MPGLFISFEGTEGSGKSANAAWLAEALRAHGRPVLLTREPGGTPLGEEIRRLILGRGELPGELAALLLFAAARAEHVARVLAPRLAAGEIAICDRFADSTLAYQGFGSGLPMADVEDSIRLATRGLRPDLTVLLDLDPELGLRRRAGTGDWNTMDAQTLAFHRRVRQGFLTLAAREPARWLVVDALLPLPAVQARVLGRVERLLAAPASPAGTSARVG